MSINSLQEHQGDDSQMSIVEQPSDRAAHGDEKSLESDATAVNPWDPSQFPDGGREAWLVLAGAFCCVFCSFGWINCIGIFQSYYQTHQLAEYSSSTISWIASLEIFMMFAGGPVVGTFYDRYGPRYLLIIGTFFHVFGLMMTSLCKEYYQFILAQGICSSIGLCCLFSPATNATTTWFFKKRAFALGIVAAGSSLGGVIFPIALNHLIDEVGFGWALRICAFIILTLLVFGILTIRSRLPPAPRKFSLPDYFKPYTDRNFALTAVGAFLFFLGLFVPINYVQFQALSYGMAPSLANYIIPILNAASLFGRILPGYISDRLGFYNMQCIMCFFTGILVLALWIPAKDNAALIAFAALYGFGSGAFVSLLPALVARISDIREIGLRIGMIFATTSLAALASNPIAGAILDNDNGSFQGLQIYCGVVLLAGSTLFVLARVSLAGAKITAKA